MISLVSAQFDRVVSLCNHKVIKVMSLFSAKVEGSSNVDHVQIPGL